MMRSLFLRVGLGAALTGILLLALAQPALAGGWAVVTLDTVPQAPHVGQQLMLGFMVRQHGVTPIDGAYGVSTLQPVLTARNRATGQTVQAMARKDGGLVGHFVVDVTFPAAGAWDWGIEPAPFEATQLGTLTVLPALPAGQADDQAGRVLPAWLSLATLRQLARWSGLLLVIVAGALAVLNQRGGIRRWGRLRVS
jgi:hypothetical protein